VNDVIKNTGKLPLTMADIPGEAFPVLNSVPAPDDDDHDGMPNAWELAHGLNPDDDSDRNLLATDGYTMLEKYLNSIEFTTNVESIKLIKTSENKVKIYPNPFRNDITIEFNVPARTMINIKIADITGKVINNITNRYYETGNHSISWNGEDAGKNILNPGIYFCTIIMGNHHSVQKLMFLK